MPQPLDRRQKTIVYPTRSPTQIPRELGQLIFLTAWKMAGDIRISEARCQNSFRAAALRYQEITYVQDSPCFARQGLAASCSTRTIAPAGLN